MKQYKVKFREFVDASGEIFYNPEAIDLVNVMDKTDVIPAHPDEFYVGTVILKEEFILKNVNDVLMAHKK
jgi:hypothetical protein